MDRFKQWCIASHGHQMQPHPEGEWVRYEAVADLALYREFVDAFDAWCKSDGDRLLWQAMLTKREGLP